MADSIVLYSGEEHLIYLKDMAVFISKHYPSISIVLMSTAASHSIEDSPSVVYRRLPTPELPPDSKFNVVELFFEIPRLNNQEFRAALEDISKESRIRAVVLDFFCNSSYEVTKSLNLPTYFSHIGASTLCVLLHWPNIHESIPVSMADFNDFVVVPGCPSIHSSDIPLTVSFRESNTYKHFLDVGRNMRESAGIFVSTFHALEPRAMEALTNGLCIPDSPSPPVYPFGPFINAVRSKGGDARHECLQWLDLQPNRSVVFLCFGRRGVFSSKQLQEIAVGLENSGYRFLWTVRNPPELQSAGEPDLAALLPAGFLDRTKERGFIIKSWAPQTEVLCHGSVGGFVTHCGQNSVMEALTNGVPMIGWPLYAEQRMCRVVLVEEIRLALPLDEEPDGLVTAAELEKRIKELMDPMTGQDIRRRTEEMGRSAATAVGKGGSSVVALEKFMDKVLSLTINGTTNFTGKVESK